MYLRVFISVDTTDHTSEMPLFTEIKEKNIRPASTDDILILLLTLFFETFKFANVQDVQQSQFSCEKIDQ